MCGRRYTVATYASICRSLVKVSAVAIHTTEPPLLLTMFSVWCFFLLFKSLVVTLGTCNRPPLRLYAPLRNASWPSPRTLSGSPPATTGFQALVLEVFRDSDEPQSSAPFACVLDNIVQRPEGPSGEEYTTARAGLGPRRCL